LKVLFLIINHNVFRRQVLGFNSLNWAIGGHAPGTSPGEGTTPRARRSNNRYHRQRVGRSGT
jgi:hypothetical protein